MNRLNILLTMMVVMVGALFAGHQALATNLTGTSGKDTLLGTDGDDRLDGRGGDDEIEGDGGNDRLKGRGGDDEIEGGSGNDEIFPGNGDDEVDAGAGNDLIYARDTDGVDFIDCGGGFDKVETIHRDDRTKSNCERALGPRQGEI
jgi:Ca2+-binding RTX toxin-like protein